MQPETYQTGVIDLDKDLSSSSEKSKTNPKSFGSPSFVKNDSSMPVLNGDKHEKLDSNESLRSENGSLLNKYFPFLHLNLEFSLNPLRLIN